MSKTIKIFYSWQSDLSNKFNRTLIGNAIDDAVKSLRDTVKIEVDRDTLNESGSPNIEETIFRKIEECDVFVADVSIVGSYEDHKKRIKPVPNANVMMELGYAVHALGWERVICINNNTYGKEESLPFDLNHHRVKSYSVDESNKTQIQKEIRDIVTLTVMDVIQNGTRAKKGFASYIVGCFDYDKKIVKKELIPTEIGKSEYAINNFISNKDELKACLDKVLSIKLDKKQDIESQTNIDGKSSNSPITVFSRTKVRIPENKMKSIRDAAYQYFGMNLDDDFFDLGNLEKSSMTVSLFPSIISGTDQEKEKFKIINYIFDLIGKIAIFENYLKTFDDLLFFELAVWNTSRETDKDVSIDVIVDLNQAEAVPVDEKLIYPPMTEVAGLVYKENIIEPLLGLKNNSEIHDGSDYEVPDMQRVVEHANLSMVDPLGYDREPQYDIDDYVDEMNRYIASPINGYGEYSFHVSSIRPNEKVWVGKGILLRPKTKEITISYKITSEKTDGNINGNISFSVDGKD